MRGSWKGSRLAALPLAAAGKRPAPATLNHATSRQQQYAYQLVGYNNNWVAAAPRQRSASFANLPPGNYTFRVRASNGDGLWSAAPATLGFTILPPWWKTWWAYLLYALALGGHCSSTAA